MAKQKPDKKTLPGLVLCGLFGALLGIGGFTMVEGEAFSYLGDESITCANCHIMRDHYDAWQKASHHTIATCNDCHVPQSFIPKYLAKAANGYNHSKAFTLQNFHDPIQIHKLSRKLVQDNCIRCHGEMLSQVLDSGCLADGSVHCTTCTPRHASPPAPCCWPMEGF